MRWFTQAYSPASQLLVADRGGMLSVVRNKLLPCSSSLCLDTPVCLLSWLAAAATSSVSPPSPSIRLPLAPCLLRVRARKGKSRRTCVARHTAICCRTCATDSNRTSRGREKKKATMQRAAEDEGINMQNNGTLAKPVCSKCPVYPPPRPGWRLFGTFYTPPRRAGHATRLVR